MRANYYSNLNAPADECYRWHPSIAMARGRFYVVPVDVGTNVFGDAVDWFRCFDESTAVTVRGEITFRGENNYFSSEKKH